jgi:hypothetical protein
MSRIMSRTLEVADDIIKEMVQIDLAGSDINQHIDALASRYGIHRDFVEELAGTFTQHDLEAA